MCEHPELYEEKTCAARKTYKCCECGDSIRKGTKYRRCKGVIGREWSVYCLCLRCGDARDKYMDSLAADDCLVFGQLLYELGTLANDMKADVDREDRSKLLDWYLRT